MQHAHGQRMHIKIVLITMTSRATTAAAAPPPAAAPIITIVPDATEDKTKKTSKHCYTCADILHRILKRIPKEISQM